MYIQTARENKAIGGAFIMLVTIRERKKKTELKIAQLSRISSEN
jgi:hypothetical protein